MINEQLLNYIRQALASGTSKENIQSSLISSGWREEDINAGFLAVNQQSSNNTELTGEQLSTPKKLDRNELMDRPDSVKYFENIMYSSIVLSIFVSVFHYAKYPTSTKSFYVLLLVSITVSIFCTYFAAVKKANWARHVLFVLFIIGLPSLFSVFPLFFIKSVHLGINFISGLLIILQMALKFAALYFIFSKSSNEWFSPQPAKSAVNPNRTRIMITTMVLFLNVLSTIGLLAASLYGMLFLETLHNKHDKELISSLFSYTILSFCISTGILFISLFCYRPWMKWFLILVALIPFLLSSSTSSKFVSSFSDEASQTAKEKEQLIEFITGITA